MPNITLIDGSITTREDYVIWKSAQLIHEGFRIATEEHVSEQLTKVINNASDLSIVGLYIKDDILKPQPYV